MHYYEEKLSQHDMHYRDVGDYIAWKIARTDSPTARLVSEKALLPVREALSSAVAEMHVREQELRNLLAKHDTEKHLPAHVVNELKLQLQMLQAAQVQRRLRTEMMQGTEKNEYPSSSITSGDVRYERVLVDREFYRRAKVLSIQNK